MTAQEAFTPILDSDEKIIESFKPQKFRFIGLGMIWDVIKGLFVALFGILFLFLSTLDGWVDEDGNPAEGIPSLIGWIIIGFAVLLIIIAIVWRLVKYKKVWFCYTNKRIITTKALSDSSHSTGSIPYFVAISLTTPL